MIKKNESLHPGGSDLTLAAAVAAGFKAGDRVLDVGCGTGVSLALLTERYGIIPRGIDCSDAAVHYASLHHPELDIKLADAGALPYDDMSFDHVLMECVLSLLTDPAAAISEALRVLKPGGSLIISTLTGQGEEPHIPGADDMTVILSEDRTADLTQYMIDSIMEYGSLGERISSESALTGIPAEMIFGCGDNCCTVDVRNAGYRLIVLRKSLAQAQNGTPVDHLVADRIGVRYEDLTQEAVEEYQIQAFRRTLSYARDHSKFYGALLKDICPDDIRTMEDIRDIPMTSESDLAGNEWQFQCINASEVDRNVTVPVLGSQPAVTEARTTGTTGRSKRISYTQEDQERSIEFINRGFMTMDCRKGERMLIFMSGQTEGSIGDMVIKAMVPLGMDIRVYGAVTDIRDAYDALMEFRPQVVEAIPWHAAALARYGTQFGNPEREFIRSVNLSADVVPDAIVKRLEDLWGCTVHRHYGTTEMAIFGGVECIHHQGYHIRPCDILYEIPENDENGYGEMLITTLDRKGMPLIRYRTGDIARFIDTQCACGCRIRRIEKFLGRKSNQIVLPGTSFYLVELAEVLYSIPEVIDFDAELTPAADDLLITIRTLPGETTEECKIREQLRCLNCSPEIRFEETTSFPGGYNLKKKVSNATPLSGV